MINLTGAGNSGMLRRKSKASKRNKNLYVGLYTMKVSHSTLKKNKISHHNNHNQKKNKSKNRPKKPKLHKMNQAIQEQRRAKQRRPIK